MADGSEFLAGKTRPNVEFVSRKEIRAASLGLVRSQASYSCSNKVRHSSSLTTLAVMLGVLGLFQPLVLLWGISLLGLGLFAVLITIRVTLVILELIFSPASGPSPKPIREVDLPVYSVMVPLYKEAASVGRLVQDMKAFDYPQEKLEVLFLIEAEDAATLAALAGEDLPAHWHVLVLPDGMPRTKPRALNVALQRLTGEFATIYDAEDTPHPRQLRAAIGTFRKHGARLGCVQAPLRAYNADESWLAAQWALEYEVQFGLILPALAKAGLPIALGGTSNHFRVSALQAAGGWDAWNVTEDADLGLRLARLGYDIKTTNLPTMEEAPESLQVWVPQRSRWIKGYMQSLGVLWRRPTLAGRQMGVRAFVISQIMLCGAVLSAFVHGPVMLACLAFLFVPGLTLAPYSALLLIAGMVVCALSAFAAPGDRGVLGYKRILLVLSLPFYLPLLSLAAYRAAYELVKTPYSWSKTPHALTRATLFSASN